MSRKRGEEHQNHERWLVSYADLITLLFALFVILYSMSQADIAKFKQVAEGMKKAFAGGPPAPAPPEDLSASSPADPGSPSSDSSSTEPGASAPEQSAAESRMREIQERLTEAINLDTVAGAGSEGIGFSRESDGLVLRLAIQQLYSPGSSQLAHDFEPLLDRIGRVASKYPGTIRIEGYADPGESVAAREKGFASEWELSAARAAGVAEIWSQRFAIPGERLRAVGRSRFLSLKSGAGATAQAANRRIEIVFEKQ